MFNLRGFAREVPGNPGPPIDEPWVIWRRRRRRSILYWGRQREVETEKRDWSRRRRDLLGLLIGFRPSPIMIDCRGS